MLVAPRLGAIAAASAAAIWNAVVRSLRRSIARLAGPLAPPPERITVEEAVEVIRQAGLAAAPAPAAQPLPAPAAPVAHGPYIVLHTTACVHDLAAGALCPCLPGVTCTCGEVLFDVGMARDRTVAPIAQHLVPGLPRPTCPAPTSRQ